MGSGLGLIAPSKGTDTKRSTSISTNTSTRVRASTEARASAARFSRSLSPRPTCRRFDIGLGRCNRELLAGLLGAAGGGFLGAQIGDGRGQLAAVAGGTLLGFLIGGSVGRSMDAVDQNCVGQAIEHANDGQAIAWDNPNNGGQYRVVPTQTVDRGDGRYCREYTAESIVGGQVQQTYGTACRQPDGSWELQG